MLKEPEFSAGPMGHLDLYKVFTFFTSLSLITVLTNLPHTFVLPCPACITLMTGKWESHFDAIYFNVHMTTDPI